MDDLTTLKGIGKATEKKLQAAGIDSFAKLAAATPDQLNAALVAGGQADWVAMIAEGARLAPPAEPRQLSDDELLALVQSWDDARAELNAAGTAVADLQAKFEAAPDDADVLDLATELAAARDRVAAAQATIEALRPLPEGVRLPDAKKPETAPEAEVAVAALPALDDLFVTALNGLADEYGVSITAVIEAARLKLAARDDLAERDALTNELDAADSDDGEDDTAPVWIDVCSIFGSFDSMQAHVFELATSDLDAANAFIDRERARIQEALLYANQMDIELAGLQVTITRTETVWPLTAIRYDGEDRPIGVPLKVDLGTFTALTMSGAAADHPPEHDAQVE